MDWSNDNCPVCDNAAKEALPRMGDFAEIICDDCGRYRVTGSALEVIRFASHEDRTRALRRAKKHADREGGMAKITYDDVMKD